jgi:hypothetical protein
VGAFGFLVAASRILSNRTCRENPPLLKVQEEIIPVIQKENQGACSFWCSKLDRDHDFLRLALH